MALRDPSSSGSFEAASDYQVIAASSTNITFQGGNGTKGGAVGDYIRNMQIIPATTSPGAVTITDGNGSAITVFTGGATSVQGLAPIWIELCLKARNPAPGGGTAGWKITTGANVSVIVCGDAQ